MLNQSTYYDDYINKAAGERKLSRSEAEQFDRLSAGVGKSKMNRVLQMFLFWVK